MSRTILVKIQLVVQFIVPNLIWIIFALSNKDLSFPIGNIESHYPLFPKLDEEVAVLREVYSEGIAIRYGLSYANTFFLGLVVLFLGVLAGVLAKPLVPIMPDDHLPIAKSEALPLRPSMFMAPRNETLPRKPSIAPALAFIAVLAYFIFFQAITYHPTPGVSHAKQLHALYAAFTVAFPLFFFLIYLLVVGRLSRPISQFIHHSRK